jgi:ribosomal protein L1
MAKKKADLLVEAKALGANVSEKNTVAEISEAIKNAAASEQTADEKPKDQTEETKIAKAGKRSAKALREQAELDEKEARKVEQADEADNKPKQPQNPTRTRLERRSKSYRNSADKIDRTKQYTLTEAVDLVLSTSTVKFDATVELHARLNVDPKQADQNIRDSVVLPAGTGKTLRVAVFADEATAKEAKKAGADIADSEGFLDKLAKNELDFDVLIATPDMMPKLGKYAKVLGPKGLMPNPKSGTVTKEPVKAIEEAKAGKTEYRVDEAGIIHLAVGKVSFGKQKLQQNLNEAFKSIKLNKPSSIKGAYVKSLYLTTSMGPSIQLMSSELA